MMNLRIKNNLIKKISTLGLFLLITQLGHAQYALKKAGGSSGIFAYRAGNVLSYDFSKDKAVFTLGKHKQPSSDSDDRDSYPDIADARTMNFSFGIPVSKSVGAIFDGSRFQPGIELAFDYAFINENNNTKDEDQYNLTFIRAIYENQLNKFIYNDPSGLSTFVTKDRLTHKLGLGVGLNLVSKTYNVFAFSVIPSYNWNSASELKSKEIIKSQTIGPNQNGSNLILNEKEERFLGSPREFGETQIRADVSIPFSNGKTELDKVGVGFLTSLSYKLRTANTKDTWNFSAGLSVLKANNYRQVTAAILFDFVDFTDANDEKDFKDIFGINFYIGLPFAVLGL